MIVVDTSVIADALVQQPLADLRRRLAGEVLHAPDLIDHEIVGALRGLALGRHISAARAQDALTDYDDLAIRRHASTPGLRASVWMLRDTMTSYDAAFVVVADRLGCPLWTRDRRLASAARRHVDVEVV
ncbi:type II toxin-antitoxin system VapC family toxin [Georgenia sp. Z1491]|uniref:type II toxin-antitoxin system VapC family toxin n=1 Tax=Georgenia sp. Z1491 TaxID=3416707 RepID=UPI003CE825E3